MTIVLLVSIIIPVYNAAPSLAGTITSALRQSYCEKEIIIVDDGSTDNSYNIAKRFESARVKVFRQPNSGAAVARNRGLSMAKGQYIQFLDAGDLLGPDKIEKQVAALAGSQNRLAVCNYIQFRREEELSNPVCPDQSRFIFSTDKPVQFLVNLWGGSGESNFVQTNCWLVPRLLIERAGAWRPYRCPDDDGEFFTRVILVSKGIVYVPGVYNYFRVGDGANELSGSTDRRYLKNTLLTIDLKHQYILRHGGHPRLNAALAKQYLDFAVYHFPSQKQLSALAIRRYRLLKEKAEPPLLGGKIVEGLKSLVGWRAVRLFQYHIREKFR